VLVQHPSGRRDQALALLYVNVVFAGAALAGAIPLVRNQQRNSGARLDVPGSLLVASGLVAVVYGFSQAGVIASANLVSNVGLDRFGPKRIVPAA
jgi:hypothetical protein